MAVNHNLLEYSSIPLQMEIRVNNAALESPGKRLPYANVRRHKGGLHTDVNRPAKINIDTYNARKSMGYGMYKMSDFWSKEVSRAWKLTFRGVADIVQDGNELVRGSAPSEIAVRDFNAELKVQTQTVFFPGCGADLTYEPGEYDISFKPDDVDVDWENIRIGAGLIYKPGSVEIRVKQRPALKFKYVGDPIYFPPSANPKVRFEFRV